MAEIEPGLLQILGQKLSGELSQQGIDALMDGPEGALGLVGDLRFWNRSDVLDPPHFNPLPVGLDPVLGISMVLRLHEHEHVAGLNQSRRGPPPVLCRIRGEAIRG